MTYFKNFSLVEYRFGDEDESSRVLVEDLSIYVDLLDQVDDLVSFYETYTILDGDRPDTLSYKLYGSVDYYWTFYLMNPGIRESGWPLTGQQLQDYTAKTFNGLVVNYRDLASINELSTSAAFWQAYFDQLLENETFQLRNSSNDVILDFNEMELFRNHDLQQLIIKPVTKTGAEMHALVDEWDNILWQDPGQTIGNTSVSVANASSTEPNATHHYENSSGEWIDPNYGGTYPIEYTDPTGSIITNAEYLESQNEQARRIRVIKPNIIQNVVSEFQRLVKG